MHTSLTRHLADRGLNALDYPTSLSLADDRVVFWLWTLSGKLAGYQTYKPHAPKTRDGKGLDPRELRYFTWVTNSQTGLKDSCALFGFERFDWRKSKLFLVEGVFDAVKLHSLGLNALAVLGNDPKPLAAQLACFRGMEVVGVLDNDTAGRELAKFCDRSYTCPGHDLGDMTLDEARAFLAMEL